MKGLIICIYFLGSFLDLVLENAITVEEDVATDTMMNIMTIDVEDN